MSTNVVFEQPEKKRAELENEWTSLNQKIQAMKENMRELEEKITAKLEEKVKARREAFEKLECENKNLEKKLEELQENQKPSSLLNEPLSEVAEKEEESPSKRNLCKYCGAENITDAAFCEKCGKKIRSVDVPSS